MRRPHPDSVVRSSAQTEEFLEDENEKLVQEMTHKVSALKTLTIDIGDEVRGQNRMLKGMHGDFDKTEGLLSGTMRRVKEMGRWSHQSWMCYMILFVVAIFFVTYYLIR
ncbi:BET1 homolog [Corticium candelabrum]|uniref:BET1 homolog n=1 Tax=Corticium candelabrum TaxID=121492 RepID=UPI002E252C7D|nr:BET1 homolog [Corticium candelabrum]